MEKHRNPDGTFDGIGVMSDLTGMPCERLKRLAEEVKANRETLDSCAYHEFERIIQEYEPAWSRQRYRCRHCGGEIDAHAYYWHEQGRRVRP